jgi:hypothetical protein
MIWRLCYLGQHSNRAIFNFLQSVITTWLKATWTTLDLEHRRFFLLCMYSTVIRYSSLKRKTTKTTWRLHGLYLVFGTMAIINEKLGPVFGLEIVHNHTYTWLNYLTAEILIKKLSKGKCEVFPVPFLTKHDAMQVYWGSEGRAPRSPWSRH